METSSGTQEFPVPQKGIKRRILEVLAALDEEPTSEKLRSILDYRGRNWTYFTADLIERRLIDRDADEAGRERFALVSEEVRGRILSELDPERIREIRSLAERRERGRTPSGQEEPADAPAETEAERPFAGTAGLETAPGAADETECLGKVNAGESEGGDRQEEGHATAPGRGTEAKQREIEFEQPPASDQGAGDTSRARRRGRRSRTGGESGKELTRLVEEALRRGDDAAALAFATDGIEGRYRRSPDDDAEEVDVSCRLRAGLVHLRNYRLAEAISVLEPILARRIDSPGVDPVLVAKVQCVAGEIALAGGRLRDAEACLERSRTLCSDAAGELALRQALLEAGIALARTETSQAFHALDSIEEVPADPVDRARVALLRGRALLGIHEFERAIPHLQEAIDIFRNRGHLEGEREAALHLGWAFHYRAQFAKSDAFLERADALAKELGNRPAELDVGVARAAVLADRGDVDRLGELVEVLKFSFDDRRVDFLEARAEALRGHKVASIKKFRALANQKENPRLAVRALREMGAAFRALNKPDEAVRPLRRALSLAEELRHREEIARTGIELALAYLDRDPQNDATNAVVAVKKALRLLEFLDAPDLIWRGYYALGRIYYEQGRFEDAYNRFGEATGILDQLLGRFQDRRDRENFLAGRFEAYRDRVVAFLRSRPYEFPVQRLSTAGYSEFLDFLRKNADAEADVGPRYNEIGRLSEAFFELYEASAPASLEEVAQDNEVLAALRRVQKVVTKPDAGSMAGELLSEAMVVLGARMGAVGLLDWERDDRFDYFKARNLPSRDRAHTDAIRAVLREVSRVEDEVMLDSRDRIGGPGEPRAIGFPLPGTARFGGALVLWYKKTTSPTNRELELVRLIVAVCKPSIQKELRLREARMATLEAARQSAGAKPPSPSEPAAASEEDDEAAKVVAGSMSLRQYLESKERELLVEALERHSGDLSATARALGFSRANLEKKLARFGLHVE